MEKVIIYGLGKCWNDHWREVARDYEIVCCIDRDIQKNNNTKGFTFAKPEQIRNFEYDKLIICTYGVGIGIREEIILAWNITVDKIYYYEELYENGDGCVRTDEKLSGEHIELTVVIPTYNRKKRISRTLDILERQTCKNFKVIILDNASDYDMQEVLEKKDKEFQQKVEVRRNISNIGMHGNLAQLFLQISDGWMWTLADDDIPSVYAVEIIIRGIEKNRNIGAFWFSINSIEKYINTDRMYISDLSELVGFYKRINEIEKDSFEGDFVYLSNKVYNVSCAKRYLEKVFTYAYTGIPQLMPILYMLSEKKAELVISNRKIVMYDAPEKNHWNWLKVALGMSTITDMSLVYVNDEEKKLLYRLIMLNPDSLLNAVMGDVTDEAINSLKKLYDNIYKLYLGEEERRRYLESLSLMKQSLVKKQIPECEKLEKRKAK